MNEGRYVIKNDKGAIVARRPTKAQADLTAAELTQRTGIIHKARKERKK